jgi:hypothetical protein
VHDQIAGHDPPADRTGCDVKTFRDFGDSGKFNVTVPVTATTDMAESSRFHVAAAGLGSRAHFGLSSPASVPELLLVAGTAVPVAACSTIRWKGVFGTNKRRPILRVGMSPRFAAS